MTPTVIKITDLDANQRLDKFVRKYLPNAPLGAIFSAIRKWKIKLSGKKVDQNTKIEDGDTIEFYFTQEEMQLFQKDTTPASTSVVRGKSLDQHSIIYEDDDILVVNKDPGINVHPWDYKTKEISLIELVHDYLWDKYDSLSFTPSLVHRIDRDTSGAIMIAKNKPTLESLLTLLQNGKIIKKYHTLVLWTPKPTTGTIDAKLLRVENAKNEAKVRVDPLGQKAVTHYQCLNPKICDKYALLECTIETGRTHQIRVHLSSIGHPIIGDTAYGNTSENSFARRAYSITRQLLHAQSLELIHPRTKKSLKIEAPYKEDMYRMIESKKMLHSPPSSDSSI